MGVLHHLEVEEVHDGFRRCGCWVRKGEVVAGVDVEVPMDQVLHFNGQILDKVTGEVVVAEPWKELV
jgi:hypothetical protein